MKLGLEDKKKVGALSGLMLLAILSYVYFNVLPDSGSSTSTTSSAAGGAAAKQPRAEVTGVNTPAAQSTQPRPLITNRPKTDEFHPVLRARNRQAEQAPDPTTIDPTIHIEMLAKVQDAKMEGGQRNLFQFGAAPPPELKGDEPKVKPVQVARVFDYPRPYTPPPPPEKKPDPPPTPPSFKYYGLATKKIDNKRTAFFLDGEEIILATEGMTVKSRWKVIRINAENVMLEDSQNKKQQTLAISEEAGGSGPGQGNE